MPPAGSKKTPRGKQPGNPGGIKYARPGEIEALGTPEDYVPPTPIRPLGKDGAEWWEWVWRAGVTWLHPVVDRQYCQVVAEMVDERLALRKRVMELNDWTNWRERGALRVLEKELRVAMGDLGFTPTERAKMLRNPSAPSALDELMERRQARAKTANTATAE